MALLPKKAPDPWYSGRFSGKDFLRGNNKCNEENKIRESICTFRGEHRNDKCKWESWN